LAPVSKNLSTPREKMFLREVKPIFKRILEGDILKYLASAFIMARFALSSFGGSLTETIKLPFSIFSTFSSLAEGFAFTIIFIQLI